MKTTYCRTPALALMLVAGSLSCASADTAGTPSPFSRTLQRVTPLAVPTVSPSPSIFRATNPVILMTVKQAPTGFRQAQLGDCDGRSDVRAAAGGTSEACKVQLNQGSVVFYWDQYRETDCAITGGCPIGGYDIVNFRTKVSALKIPSQTTTAAIVPQAKLGDCFTVRATRALEGPDSSPHCVLVVRSTVRTLVGPTDIGQFQALIHDNHDHGYCTRRSWDTSWAPEPWGFSTAIHSLKEPAGNTGAGISLTVGQIAQEHAGSGPFPCPESLNQIWRGVLDFDLPADAKSGNASIVFAFTPAGVASDIPNCFQYLWNPHRWYIHEGPEGHYVAPLIGEINGKVLDHDASPIGALSFASGRASYSFGADPSILGSGHLAVELSMLSDDLNSNDLGNPQLHVGNYLTGTHSTFCGAKNPRLELTYVRVQTTAQPFLPQFDNSIQQKVTPHVLVTSAPN